MSDRKEYMRKYQLKNKQKMKKYIKLYQLKNKQKIAKRMKKYRQANKKKIAKRAKEYLKTESGKKTNRISQWKRNGIFDHYDDDYTTIYKIYRIQKMCSVCFKVFNNKKRMNLKCIDHCHNTGKIRRICCNYCNLNVVK